MPSSRLASIDIFRGLTIFTMIFVNDVASVTDIPWWMKHMSQNANGMTFVDVVFPAFLFIVGMAIPYALEKRLTQTGSLPQVIGHILLRTAGLLALGILMVNIHGLNDDATGIPHSWWMLILFLAVILVWNSYPDETTRQRLVSRIARVIGFIALAILVLIYRGGEASALHWLQTSWWGILGLIGWAYLVSSVIYLAFRRHLAAVAGSVAVLTLMYVGDKTGAFGFAQWVREYIFIGGHIGGHASITTAGMVAAMLLRDRGHFTSDAQRIRALLILAGFLAAAGFLLNPLYGVNKVAATPAWCLYCSAICSALIAGLYWIVDVRGVAAWAKFVSPAGSNPLLAYILPDIWYAALGIIGAGFAGTFLGTGIGGIIRALAISTAVMWMTRQLGKQGVRLHL